MLRRMLIAVAALSAMLWAATPAVSTPEKTPMTSAGSNDDATDAVTIPRMLSYQGKLLDNVGNPVLDTTYSVLFSLYTVPSGGSAFWSETQTARTKVGLFSVLLGSVTPIDTLPDAGALYLGMKVGADPEMLPRLRIVSAAYAYLTERAANSDLLQGRDTSYFLRSGQPLPSEDWVNGGDSVLYTVRWLGIARGGAFNNLYGTERYSHVNLGVTSTTGADGYDYAGATVSGGAANAASRDYATVGGGLLSAASGGYATVGGGYRNTASGYYATIVGGYENIASGFDAAVGGGTYNTASGSEATVPGGDNNYARGYASLAAGSHAFANHKGSFVWGDSASPLESVYTTGPNQFRVRARGGAWFFSNMGMSTGAYLAPGSNAWISACDSATKEDFRPVDRKALLDKVAAMRVRNYKMKDQSDGTRHIGPVAQEFHAAFGVGETEKGINMADADGVLLAAVQALYEQNQLQQVEIEALKAEMKRR